MVTIFGYFQKPIKAQDLQVKGFEVEQESLEISSTPLYTTGGFFLAILRRDMGNIQIIPQGFSYISYIDFSGNHAVKSPLIALKNVPLSVSCHAERQSSDPRSRSTAGSSTHNVPESCKAPLC